MKKKLTIAIVTLLLGTLLTACGGSAATPTSAPVAPTQAAVEPSTAATGNPPPEGAPGDQPVQNQIAVGTLKLEGTALAVTADQAKTLLPLWQQVKTLMEDTQAKTEDIEAVYQQIEAAMSADQMTAIDALDLSQSDLEALMTQYGVQITPGAGPMGTPGAPGGNPPAAQGTPGANSPGPRGTPGGNPPNAQGTPGGPGGGPGGVMGGGRRGMSAIFIDPLIELLQERAGG